MSVIDEYLAGIEAPQRAALEHVRSLVRQIAPDAEEGKSYGMPAWKYRKRPLLGFLAAKDHLSIFPFSPQVIDSVRDRLTGFELSKGTIRFTVAKPIPDDLLRAVVRARMDEIG